MLIFAKMLAKYFIIIYALGSVHEKFGVWNKAVPFRSVRFMKGSESEPGLRSFFVFRRT